MGAADWCAGYQVSSLREIAYYDDLSSAILLICVASSLAGALYIRA